MTLTISVTRDVEDPYFSRASEDPITVKESEQVGEVITRIKARDNDLQGELIYEVVGEMPAPIQFGLENEDIVILTDLRSSKISNFLVRINK